MVRIILSPFLIIIDSNYRYLYASLYTVVFAPPLLGYPQLLSGTYRKLGDVASKHQKVYFPEANINQPWQHANQIKRYRLSFPFFPFRTLCSRELVLSKMLPSPFEPTSPLFPAHTQINLCFKRKSERNFLDCMLPENLPVVRGSIGGTLTEAERNTATRYRANNIDYSIKKVTVKLDSAYLLVLRIKYKGLSPERPLSNVYTSYRSTFTPLTKVSLHQYPLSWESSAKPTAVFISFIK